MKQQLLILGFLFLVSGYSSAQTLNSIEFDLTDGLNVKSFNGFQHPGYQIPLVSFELDDELMNSGVGEVSDKSVVVNEQLEVTYNQLPFGFGIKAELRFKNLSNDTLKLANVVPFGASPNHVYITGHGNNYLSRTHLFRPGYVPANIIVPDNAWELGFAVLNVDNGNSISALTRRDKQSASKVQNRRFETIMYPGGKITYVLWMEDYIGTWQEGLRRVFQERMLYDVEPGEFDNSIFEREDLKWIRNSWVTHFVQVWHSNFYNRDEQKYTLLDFQEKAKKLYGGDDNIILWHGFPMLGMDQRNQWDMFRALPGGIEVVREMADELSKNGTGLMTAYMPWDLPAGTEQLFNSTRTSDHYEDLGKLAKEAHLKGVMYDTRSEGNTAMQDVLDQYTDSFVVFPEGMSVPKNMQHCVVGRVHAALNYPPFLNLNKFIKPEFAILQQIVIEDNDSKREVSTAFFNGYGVEIHLRVPVETPWLQDLYKYMGKTRRIQVENAGNFIAGTYTPLLPTTADSIWVNQWKRDDKIIYTLYSIRPDGNNAALFEVKPSPDNHFVDLWNHREIIPARVGGKHLLKCDIEPFDKQWLGTSSEGSLGCIAQLPNLLDIQETSAEEWLIKATKGNTIKIWNERPNYGTEPLVYGTDKKIAVSRKELENTSGDIIVQLFQGQELLDERIIAGTQIRISDADLLGTVIPDTAYFKGEGIEVDLNLEQDIIHIDADKGDKIIITPVDDENISPVEFNSGNHQLEISSFLGAYRGGLQIKLMQGGKELSVGLIKLGYGVPKIISKQKDSPFAMEVPVGMVEIPAGSLVFVGHQMSWGSKYPLRNEGKEFTFPRYFMDKYPITNQEFKEFIDASGYRPKDDENYLKHWGGENIPDGQENFPVVYVSIDDARAYAKWAKKRIPSELEWQYAAQGPNAWLWPWGNSPDSTGVKCNPGNGVPDQVGEYPKGANPYGLEDLTGCVWQLTDDVYTTGLDKYVLLKGGSYFNPKASWWYVEGGAKPLTHRQQHALVSPGYERCATIGFRCVKDAGKDY